MKKHFFTLIILLSTINLFSQNENQFSSLDSNMMSLIIDFGKTYKGVAYNYGACDSKNGFDCSGFMYYIFRMAGYKLPRSSRDIASLGKTVDLLNVKKGDLLFFNTLSSGKISHVGIVSKVTKNKVVMLHVSSSKGVQEVDIIESDYWYSRFVLAKQH